MCVEGVGSLEFFRKGEFFFSLSLSLARSPLTATTKQKKKKQPPSHFAPCLRSLSFSRSVRFSLSKLEIMNAVAMRSARTVRHVGSLWFRARVDEG